MTKEQEIEIAKHNAIYMCEQYYAEVRKTTELTKKIEDLESEIIRLKARIFDLMEDR